VLPPATKLVQPGETEKWAVAYNANATGLQVTSPSTAALTQTLKLRHSQAGLLVPNATSEKACKRRCPGSRNLEIQIFGQRRLSAPAHLLDGPILVLP